MRCCSASPQDTCAGRRTETQPAPPTLHRVSEIQHPAWLTAGSQLEQHLQMRNKPCLYTQKKVLVMPALICNKGPMATAWKDTNPVPPCWTQSDESGGASAVVIPDLLPPDPRSCLQVIRLHCLRCCWTKENHIPPWESLDCCQLEHLAATTPWSGTVSGR